MVPRLIRFGYGAALFTLPWVGVGLMTLVTGRDLGAGLQPAWVFLAAVIALAAVARTPLPPPRLSAHPWLTWLVAVGLAVALSAIGLKLAPSGVPEATAWLRWVKQDIQLVVMLAFTVWAAVWTRGADRWRFTLSWLAAGATFQLGYGLLQGWAYFHPVGLMDSLEAVFTSNPAILSGSREVYVGNGFLAVPRLRGTMCEPLYLGNYLVFLWPWLVFGGVLTGRRVRILTAGLLFLLMATWARGAWLAAAAQLGLWILWRLRGPGTGAWRPSGKRMGWILGGVGLGLVVLGLILGWDRLLLPWERLAQAFSRQDWSTLTRLYSMQAAWRAFLLSPVFGVGWGQFAFHFPLLVDPMGLQSQFSWPVVNNLPLQILCETGLIGFAVFAGYTVWLLRKALGRLGSAAVEDSARNRVLAGVLSVGGVWLQLMTFSQYNLAHIWLSVGLLIAAVVDTGDPEGNHD